MKWMFLPFRRYFEFSGRSRRKEYWLFTLFYFVVSFTLSILQFAIGGNALLSPGFGSTGANETALASLGVIGIVQLILVLGCFFPSLAVSVRRLHDTNRRGWWLLAPLVPYVVIIGAVVAGMSAVLMGARGAGFGGDGPPVAMFAIVGISLLAFMILAIVLLVFMCLEGTRGPNRFGADPKGSGETLNEVFR